jgi:hypothetical protein
MGKRGIAAQSFFLALVVLALVGAVFPFVPVVRRLE